MAVNAPGRPCANKLLAWLNESLQTRFTKVEQVSTGVAYCQLMDQLFPGSLDMSTVRFESDNMVDSIHNYSLLQAAFSKAGVVRYIPIEGLVKRNPVVTLTFLHWFKLFFDKHNKGKEAHALQARGGRSMLPPDGHGCLNPVDVKMEDVKMEDVKMEDMTVEVVKGTSEGVVIISDDDDDDEDDASMTVEQTEANEERTASSTDTLFTFIRRYCSDRVDVNLSTSTGAQVFETSVFPAVSSTHLKDIIQACDQKPYCLYLYVGLELAGQERTSVVLIGYHQESSGDSVVKLLHTQQLRVDTADPHTSANTTTDARCLIQTLEKVGLRLSNLAVFYCDAQPPVSQMFVSQLQNFSPRLVSLCGLPGMAGRTCQAGLMASSCCVVSLIRDIHHHYSTCSSSNNSLKELFAHAESYEPSRPVSSQCSFIISTLQKMVSSWTDLLEYFRSLGQTKVVDRIRTQLMDHKVKLYFLFLSYTLEPLRALQVLQQTDTVDVAVELQLISMLVHSYAAGLLRPSVAERFLRKRDLQLIFNQKELRPLTEVDVGSRARNFLSATTFKDLGEQERQDFLKDAAAFYKAALQSLAESIPENLGDAALKNINKILKHPEDKLPVHVLSELAVQLGLCDAGSPESHQLAVDYLRVIRKVKVEEDQTSEAKEGNCWGKMLQNIRPHSALHRFILTLLALPSSLCRTQVFAKVFKSTDALPAAKDSPQPGGYARGPHRRKVRPQAGDDDKMEQDVEALSEDGGDVTSTCRSDMSEQHSSSSDTDNSSDVVDVTSGFEEDSLRPQTRRIMETGSQRMKRSVETMLSSSSSLHTATANTPANPKLQGVKGELVWIQVEGFSTWPAVITTCRKVHVLPGKKMVQWFGPGVSSQVSVDDLQPFADFTQHFCNKSFTVLVNYREAVFKSLQAAAERCGKQFSVGLRDKDELQKQMLDWAFGGFKPTGPDGLKPVVAVNGVTKTNRSPKVIKIVFLRASSSTPTSSSITAPELKDAVVTLNKLPDSVIEKHSHTGGGLEFRRKDREGVANENGAGGGWPEETAKQGEGEEDDWEGVWEKGRAGSGSGSGKGRARGGKVQKMKSSLMDGFDADVSPDFVPYKKRTFTKAYNKVTQPSGVYTQPDQKLREQTIRMIMDMKLDVDGFCLCCGTEDVEMFHPLFKGSLCLKCKDNFTETLYRYDEDGYQSYCTICCYGLEVILCGNDSCCRSFCEDCLNILVGAGTFDSLKLLDPWICYLCQPHRPHGALVPREDWIIRVQELFANNSAMAFEPHRVYPSIPANQRRPIRVLSLFDGIATGYLVLKDLGFKVETYVASEVCEDSVAVATINHDGRIIHVGDARFITQKQVEQWGPFDLLIGGSPCNDLSIVNPIRKGLYEGTGRLFFEFYRILHLLKPKEEDPRPFFWLFENVVFMNTHDKVNICRFLECNPVLVDAVKVSPAHRARYFWGNIPGMSRPIIASQSHKLNLQDCLEIGREARVTKVRTITTNPNSLKQGKDVSQLPVLQNGREDNLWITELEKIFGFPKHYTDVRNMNRQQRQKVLGKAWSVPVIRHLFAPLKDYFACEELLTPGASNSSTSSSSPESPELLR